MRSLLLLCALVQAISLCNGQAQPSDGNNLETFPSIVNPSTSSTSASRSASRIFSSTGFGGPGPAISPSSYLSTALPTSATAAPTSTSSNQTTLISASGSNYTASQPDVSVATSTVSGSVTTVTITNSGASQATGTSDAARLLSARNSFGVWTEVAVVVLSVAGASIMM